MNSANTTHSSLLLRVRDVGDQKAWREFVEIYTPLVFGFVRKRGFQEADAADLVQEVMRAVARAMPDFEYQRSLGGFRAWLFRITRNKVNDHFERRRRQGLANGGGVQLHDLKEIPWAAAEPDWDEDYRQRLFQWAGARVRQEVLETTWQAFWLTAVEDQPARQVAKELGMSTGAVYIARSRVTARLREMVASVADEDSGQWILPDAAGGSSSPVAER